MSERSGSGEAARTLKIRLTPLARDQEKVTLRLEGQQRIPRDGPVQLGLFAPAATTSVDASFEFPFTLDRLRCSLCVVCPIPRRARRDLMRPFEFAFTEAVCADRADPPV